MTRPTVRIRVLYRRGKWTMAAVRRPDRLPAGVGKNVMRLWVVMEKSRKIARGLPWITFDRWARFQDRCSARTVNRGLL